MPLFLAIMASTDLEPLLYGSHTSNLPQNSWLGHVQSRVPLLNLIFNAMPDFYPPRMTPILVRLTQSLSPWLGRSRYRMRLEIAPDCLEKLAAVSEHRLLLLPNHPTHFDWVALFLLSARGGELFHYLAAYERFGSLEGRFLQRMGAYSIRRGMSDRPSVAKTLEILMRPQCRLVIFSEGGFSFQNDTVMPFRTGGVQCAMQAMNKLVKQGEPVPDFYALPIAIKYQYIGDMAAVIDSTLARLEKALWVFPASADFYDRLLVVADQVLLGFERDYGLPIQETVQRSRNERIVWVKDHILHYCEQKLEISPNRQDPLRERVYKIQRVLESHSVELAADAPRTYDSISRAAAQLLNFNAIYDGYVADSPTSERFLDTLIRLERAVFGIDQPPPKGDRKAIIRIGDPVNLKDSFELYQQQRSVVVDRLTENLRQRVQENLDLVSSTAR